MDNRAAMLDRIKTINIKQFPFPQIKAADALVKVDYNGVCGSDVHYFEYGINGNNPCIFPFLLGHECSGTVVDVGKEVSDLKVGDRVAIEPGIPCGACVACKSGKYNLCEKMEFLSAPPYYGSLRDYLAYPAHLLVKLPDQVSLMEGCLIEPLSVGIHAVRQSGVRLGDSVLICGSGCIGLVTLLAAKAAGASRVILADRIENRLAFAKKLGAYGTINTAAREIKPALAEMTSSRMVNRIIDTTGAEQLVRILPEIITRGGVITLLGSSPKEYIQINVVELINKEIKIKTVFRYRNIFPLAVDAIADGSIDIKSIVTEVYDFERTQQAFERASNDKDGTIKLVIRSDSAFE